MSDDVVQAQYDELANVAVRFGQQAQATGELTARVRQRAEALHNGDWQGRGIAAFGLEMHREVYPALDRLRQALLDAQAVTLNISAIMQAAEEEAARPFMGGAYVAAPGNGQVRQPSSTAPSADSTHRATPQEITQVKPADYALLSQAAYEEGGQFPASSKEYLEKRGWRPFATYSNDYGYSGTAYINTKTKEVVIAHRGTDSLFGIDGLGGTDTDDDIMIASGKAPQQYEKSQAFVNRVHQQMASAGYGDYTVKHTGHSLGGVLADLHASQRNEQAITFENPGSKEILGDLNRTYDPRNHITYQNNPNLINKTNQQAGYVVQIIPRRKEDPEGAPALLKIASPGVSLIYEAAKDQVYRHRIGNVVDALDLGTGNFRHQRPVELHEPSDRVVLDWNDVEQNI
ncbi:MAG: WXG100 family type VII secretion target [Caldilineaceae bacterium]